MSKMAFPSKASSDLLAAVECNDLDHVKEILQSGADPNIDSGRGDWTNPVIPLHVAAGNGHLEMTRCLLEFNADVGIVNRNGSTALHYAAWYGRIDVLELLISRCADVNKQTTVGCRTALHYASLNGFVTCVRLLLEHGADVTLKSHEGKTARGWAVTERKPDVVKLLDDFVGDERRLVASVRPVCDEVTGESIQRPTISKELSMYSTTVRGSELVALGEGGFGIVYKAEHKDWGTVALKKPKTDWTIIGASTEAKIISEIEFLANLKHPNIVQIIGIVWGKGDHGIVMEYMENGDLSEFLERYTDVEACVKVKFLCDVAAAMSYMHSLQPKSIIHRDLKAMNIFLTRMLTAKVGDFGLSEWATHTSRICKRDPEALSDRVQRSAAATITHLCPEGWADVNRQTVKFDVHSFAVVIWECFSNGIPAFKGLPEERIRSAVMHGQRPDEEILSEDMPEFVKTLMRTCWAQEPKMRPHFKDILSQLTITSLEAEYSTAIDLGILTLRRQILSLS